MRTHARYEQNNGAAQPTRKAMKVKAEKVKTEVKSDEASVKSIIGGGLNNNNDISMFNQNSLESMHELHELRMKLQENFLAHSGLMPNDISNLKREIKIEF
jgi:predicted S18 family serine protease